MLKNSKDGGIPFPDFTLLFYMAVLIKTVQYQHESKDIDQWNMMKSPEIDPCIYGQLIVDKGAKNIQWGKNTLYDK